MPGYDYGEVHEGERIVSELDYMARKVAKQLLPAVKQANAPKAARELFGTVRATTSGGETTYDVLLDGAPDYTPTTSSVTIHHGDRVICKVLDHRLVVMQNITVPSVNDTQYEHVKDIATEADTLLDGVAAVASTADKTLAEIVADANTSNGLVAGMKAAADTAGTTLAQIVADADSAADTLSGMQAAATAANTTLTGIYQTAKDAESSAAQAQSSANTANAYANAALDQLVFVEDVAGTLSWIQDHGIFITASDTSVQDGTVYFEYNSTTHDYEPIVLPASDANPHDLGWYVLDATDSQTDFIMAHLAVTTRGLWVLPAGLPSTNQTVDSTVDKASSSDTADQKQANANARQADDYKLLLSNDGQYIYDGSGSLVAVYGATAIEFLSSGSSVAKFGTDGVRVGRSTSGHTTITNDGFDYSYGNDSLFAVEPVYEPSRDDPEIIWQNSISAIGANMGGGYTAPATMIHGRSNSLECALMYSTGDGWKPVSVYESATDAIAAAKNLQQGIVYIEPGELRVITLTSGDYAYGYKVKGYGFVGPLPATTVALVEPTVLTGTPRLRLGKTALQGGSHVEVDYHSLRLIDKEGSEYFKVQDLRDASGIADVVDEFPGNGVDYSFYLTCYPASDSGVEVWSIDTVNETATELTRGADASEGDWHPLYVDNVMNRVVIHAVPQEGTSIQIRYTSEDENLKTYDFGLRRPGTAAGALSVIEGNMTTASGVMSHAEGAASVAEGGVSHAEGHKTTAHGNRSHSEGYLTYAGGNASHAEGYATYAFGEGAHAEGEMAQVSANAAHGEGYFCRATGNGAHAEGLYTEANGRGSHSQNSYTKAASASQTALGKYNVADSQTDTFTGDGSTTAFTLTDTPESVISVEVDDEIAAKSSYTLSGTTLTFTTAPASGASISVTYSLGTYAVIVGNGTADNARSNAFTLDWDGCGEFAGDLTIHGVNDANLLKTYGRSSFASAIPSGGSNAYENGWDAYDSLGNKIGYSQIANTTTGVYRSFAAQNPRLSSGSVSALYLHVADSGKKRITTTAATSLEPSGPITSELRTYGGSSWVKGASGEAALYVPKPTSSMSAMVGALAVQTASGGGWIVGNYNSEKLTFQHFTAANISSQTNTPDYNLELTPGSGIPIAYGGTSATDAAGARTNLGLGTLATKSSVSFSTTTATKTSSAGTIAVSASVSLDCTPTTPSGYVVTGVQTVTSNHNSACVVNSFGYGAVKVKNTGNSQFTDLTVSQTWRYGKDTVS